MKVPGPDCIQNWDWALAWDVIHLRIEVLFESVISMCFILLRWKVACTAMLAKPGKDDYTQPSAYRPIALLNPLAKIYEKFIAGYMSSTAETQLVLHQGHYGS